MGCREKDLFLSKGYKEISLSCNGQHFNWLGSHGILLYQKHMVSEPMAVLFRAFHKLLGPLPWHFLSLMEQCAMVLGWLTCYLKLCGPSGQSILCLLKYMERTPQLVNLWQGSVSMCQFIRWDIMQDSDSEKELSWLTAMEKDADGFRLMFWDGVTFSYPI